MLRVELMSIILQDDDGSIIANKELNRGVAAHAIFSYRHIAQKALTINAASIIFCHNYPGGDAHPTIVGKKTAVKVNSVMATIGTACTTKLLSVARNIARCGRGVS